MRIYLIDCEGRARLSYRGPTGGVQAFMLTSGEFDRTLHATWDQLDAWAEREMPTDAPDPNVDDAPDDPEPAAPWTRQPGTGRGSGAHPDRVHPSTSARRRGPSR